MDREAWCAAVIGVPNSQIGLSELTDTTIGIHRWLSGKEPTWQCRHLWNHHFDPFGEDPLKEEKATHPSILT